MSAIWELLTGFKSQACEGHSVHGQIHVFKNMEAALDCIITLVPLVSIVYLRRTAALQSFRKQGPCTSFSTQKPL